VHAAALVHLLATLTYPNVQLHCSRKAVRRRSPSGWKCRVRRNAASACTQPRNALARVCAVTKQMLTWVETKREQEETKPPKRDAPPRKRAPRRAKAPKIATAVPLAQWDKAAVAAWVKAEGFAVHVGDTFAPLSGDSVARLTEEDIVELSAVTKPIPAIVRREILAAIAKLS